MAELYTSDVKGVYSGLNITPKQGGSSKSSSSGSMTGMPFGAFGLGSGVSTTPAAETEAKTKLSDLKAQYENAGETEAEAKAKLAELKNQYDNTGETEAEARARLEDVKKKSVAALDEGYGVSADALKKSYDDQTALLRSDYNYTTGKLKAERDDALREQYIKGRQATAALPEQLARYGINGGAVETTLANLMAQYQSGRNDTRKNYLGKLAELANGYNKSAAERATAYDQNLADLQKAYIDNKANADNRYDELWIQYLLDQAATEKATKANADNRYDELWLQYLLDQAASEKAAKANADNRYDELWLQYLLNQAATENNYRLQKQYAV